ncbi:MAG: sensor histidine kinase [candidate division WOR-3 bacterium]|nr:MAG: sensor histidine kinase [candidate division WOR-3 bacterium]
MRPMRQPEFWIIVAAGAVLTVGHYTAPTDDPFWHDLFRRLYYLPIILAGLRYGLKGGLITAAAISFAFMPHVLMTRQTLYVQASESRFEMPLYFLVGIVTGIVADRQRRASESLRRAERLKTIGEMAAGMAHEIKNPLAGIRSSAQLLASRTRGGDAELVDIIVGEVDLLNKVVNDFLQYARPAPLKRGPARLGDIMESVKTLLDPVAAGRRVEIELDRPDSEPEVSCDADQVRQVLINLVLNAVQASPEGTAVRLKIDGHGDRVRASVIDSGPGIPRDRLRAVFEPFFTTKEGGTGLGLSIAQRIVGEHGGSLRLEPSPGGGTRATVELSKSR